MLRDGEGMGEVLVGAEVAQAFLDAGAVPPPEVLVESSMELLYGCGQRNLSTLLSHALA